MKKKMLIIIISILLLFLIGVLSIFVFDKYFNKENKNTQKEINGDFEKTNYQGYEEYTLNTYDSENNDSIYTYKLNNKFTIKIKNKELYVNDKKIDNDKYIYPAFCDLKSPKDYCLFDVYIIGNTLVTSNSNFTTPKNEVLYFIDINGQIYDEIQKYDENMVLDYFEVQEKAILVKASRYFGNGPSILLPNKSVSYFVGQEYVDESLEKVKSLEELLTLNNIDGDYPIESEYTYKLQDDGKFSEEPTISVKKTLSQKYNELIEDGYILTLGITY